MAKTLSPSNDFVFQKLFGTEENKDLLIALLNAILQLPEDKRLTDVTVIGGARLDKDRFEDKTGILDVRATTAKGTIINIEVQLANQYNMEKRTLFYWSRLFAGQLEKGHDYSELKKTITINILDFNYLEPSQYHNVYHLREDRVGHILTDVLEIHFIELPKFCKEKPDIEDVLHRWLIFLGQPKEEVLNMLETKDAMIGKATKVLNLLSRDPDTVRLSELREKAIWDEVSRLNGAKAEGLQQGIEQGLQQEKINIARRMLAKGAAIEDIVDITGLSVEEVSKMQN